jgi:hypothetical protein
MIVLLACNACYVRDSGDIWEQAVVKTVGGFSHRNSPGVRKEGRTGDVLSSLPGLILFLAPVPQP